MSAADHFAAVDENFAANLRERREAAGLSQDEVAQRMAERGFGFSQATVWKIEQGKRPVKISEAVALGDAVGMLNWASLLHHPDTGRHEARLESRHRKAAATFAATKRAATDYLQAQAELVIAAHDARAAGVAVPDLFTSWLRESAEGAVLEARVEFTQEDNVLIDRDTEVGKMLASLRENGYEPFLRVEDVTTGGPQPGPELDANAGPQPSAPGAP